MTFEPQLRIPGPTPIPDRVVRASARPMINHRGPEFAELISECVDGLSWALGTQNDILLFPASGTGGMEAAVTNMLSPGERVLFCSVGAFGERWAAMASMYGADVLHFTTPWGEALDPEDVERQLSGNAGDPIRKVFVTHNETSTGVTNDIAAIAAVVKKHGALLVVDSISAAGCLPLAVDELGLDVVVTSSQKGWLAPPGLAMISVSPEALSASAEATCPRWYFDFAREKGFQDELQTYMTPPVTVLYALQEGLRMMREEGLENVWDRHRRVADALRAGLAALELRFFAAEGHRSDTVTALRSPFESAQELSAFLSRLRTRHALELAGGQERLKGEIFRIGHLGMIDERDVYVILAAIEEALVGDGLLDRVGVAVPAAQAVTRAGATPFVAQERL